MSHDLDFSKGFAAIAYRGEKPWHEYGAEMGENETLESWIQRAGLGYDVIRRPVFTTRFEGDIPEAIPKMHALVRNDNGNTLSIVGDRYNVVQPRDVVEFFRNLVESQGFEIETAGALAGGRRVWALARTGKEFKLPGVEDRLLAYLLLATSYDRKFATTAQFTSVRVVCNNTLGFSLSEGERHMGQQVFRVPHQTKFDATEAQGNLGLLGDSWNTFTSQVEALAATPVSKKQAIEYYMELMGYDEEDPQHAVDNVYSIKKLLQAYETAPGQQLTSARNTAWGLTNGLTFFTDHTRRAHNNGTRINSAWFGDSALLKQKAWKQALELTKDYAEAA